MGWFLHTPSFEEYKAKRDLLHEQRMKAVTLKDAELSQHPQEPFIPRTLVSWANRKNPELFEHKVQVWFFSGFVLGGIPATMLRYGVHVTRQRWFRTSFLSGCAWAVWGASSHWTTTVYAQEPNKNEMQVMPWEQGYKNYVDKTYHLYDDSDRLFYDKLTQRSRLKEICRELKADERQKLADIEKEITEFRLS